MVRVRADVPNAPSVQLARGALPADAAALAGSAFRPEEALAVLRDAAGAPLAVSGAVPAGLELLGGLRVWVHVVAGPPDAVRPLLRAGFPALAAEPAGPDAPRGVCVLSDAAALRADAAAVWEDPLLVHAGFLPDGRQVRIGWFDRARIGG